MTEIYGLTVLGFFSQLLYKTFLIHSVLSYYTRIVSLEMKVPFAFFNDTWMDSQRLGFNLRIKKGAFMYQGK